GRPPAPAAAPGGGAAAAARFPDIITAAGALGAPLPAPGPLRRRLAAETTAAAASRAGRRRAGPRVLPGGRVRRPACGGSAFAPLVAAAAGAPPPPGLRGRGRHRAEEDGEEEEGGAEAPATAGRGDRGAARPAAEDASAGRYRGFGNFGRGAGGGDAGGRRAPERPAEEGGRPAEEPAETARGGAAGSPGGFADRPAPHLRKPGAGGDPQKKGEAKSKALQVAVAVGAAAAAYSLLFGEEPVQEITWQEFRANYLEKGLVERLDVYNRTRVRVTLRDVPGYHRPRTRIGFNIGSVEAFERNLEQAQNALGVPSGERVPVAYQSQIPKQYLLLQFAPTLIIIGLLVYLGRKGMAASSSGLFGVGKSKAKMFNKNTEVQ
ncbi:MAG: hypothetical protein BJ554DRAFT_5474, partial [Olpidium bornovanus]